MFPAHNIISASLVLAVMLASIAGCAVSGKPALQQPSTQESAATQPGVELSVDEIKLRIGPGDPVAGKSKAEPCFGCHGEDGNSADPQSPKLAGQFGIYIAKQVRNYQASSRTHQVMGALATSVSDEELADISAYFASQPMMKGEKPSGNKLGKELFENGDLSRMTVRCNSCHGASGRGQNSDNPLYPVIGGQHKEYLLGQLLGFRKGIRNNSPGGVMNTTVHRLNDAEIEALADYISGL